MDFKKQVNNWILSLNHEELETILTDCNKIECDKLRAMYSEWNFQDGYFFDESADIPGMPSFEDIFGNGNGSSGKDNKLKSRKSHSSSSIGNPNSFLSSNNNNNSSSDIEIDNKSPSDLLRKFKLEFRLTNDKSIHHFENLQPFLPERKVEEEKRIIKLIRLCDTRTRLDTFTIESNSISNTELIHLLTQLSQGGFLQVPCHLIKDSQNNWRCEQPKWFISKSFFSLGEFIAAWFESLIWTQFWENHKIDGRKDQSNKQKITKPIFKLLDSRKSNLKEFWSKQMTMDNRKKYAMTKMGNLLLSVIQSLNETPEKVDLDFMEKLGELMEDFKSPITSPIISSTNNSNNNNNNNNNNTNDDNNIEGNNKNNNNNNSNNSNSSINKNQLNNSINSILSNDKNLKPINSLPSTTATTTSNNIPPLPPTTVSKLASVRRHHHGQQVLASSSLSESPENINGISSIFEDYLVQNPIKLIEFLCFSPLERAGSTVDMIMRQIGAQLQNFYSESLSMDLINAEESSSRAGRKNRNFNNSSNGSSLNSSGNSTPVKSKKKKKQQTPTSSTKDNSGNSNKPLNESSDSSQSQNERSGSKSSANNNSISSNSANNNNSIRKKRKKKSNNNNSTGGSRNSNKSNQDKASNSDTEQESIQTRPRRHSLPMDTPPSIKNGIPYLSTTEDEVSMLSEGDVIQNNNSGNNSINGSNSSNKSNSKSSNSNGGSNNNTNNKSSAKKKSNSNKITSKNRANSTCEQRTPLMNANTKSSSSTSTVATNLSTNSTSSSSNKSIDNTGNNRHLNNNSNNKYSYNDDYDDNESNEEDESNDEDDESCTDESEDDQSSDEDNSYIQDLSKQISKQFNLSIDDNQHDTKVKSPNREGLKLNQSLENIPNSPQSPLSTSTTAASTVIQTKNIENIQSNNKMDNNSNGKLSQSPQQNQLFSFFTSPSTSSSPSSPILIHQTTLNSPNRLPRLSSPQQLSPRVTGNISPTGNVSSKRQFFENQSNQVNYKNENSNNIDSDNSSNDKGNNNIDKEVKKDDNSNSNSNNSSIIDNNNNINNNNNETKNGNTNNTSGNRNILKSKSASSLHATSSVFQPPSKLQNNQQQQQQHIQHHHQQPYQKNYHKTNYNNQYQQYQQYQQQQSQQSQQIVDKYKDWRHNKFFNQIQTYRQVIPFTNLQAYLQPWDDPPLPYPHPRFSIKLHQEILDFVSDVGERTYPHVQSCHQVIAWIRAVVKKLWSHADLDIFGSFMTGLWLPSSDIDIVVNYGNNMSIKPKNAQFLLKVLEKQIRNDLDGFILTMVCIPSAKIPVIKLVTTENISVDISFRESPTSIHTGIAARDLISECVREIVGLYPLAIVLKWFLRERGLNNTYTGGLSSYCLVLMLISFLKNNEHCPRKSNSNNNNSTNNTATLNTNTNTNTTSPSTTTTSSSSLSSTSTSTTTTTTPSTPSIEALSSNIPIINQSNQPTLKAKPCMCEDADQISGLNIGCALMRFLEYYGVNFNYQMTGISIDEGNYTFPITKDDPIGSQFLLSNNNSNENGVTFNQPPQQQQNQDNFYVNHNPFYLVVSDPFVPGRNVAAGSFNFSRVKAAFQYAFATLSNTSMNELSFENETILSKILMPSNKINQIN